MHSRMFNDTSNNIQLHTTPHTTTRQHTTTHNVDLFRTSHVKSPFSSPTQCPKVAPRWSQDGPRAVLGPSWVVLGVILSHLGAILVVLKVMLRPSWGHLGRPGAILGHLGRSWGGLGQSWGELVVIVGPSWSTWGQPWAVLGRFWGRLGLSWVV